MGWAANKARERVCKACRQSIYGSAGAIKEHVSTCSRLKALNLVVPGLVVGQQAVDVLNQAQKRKKGLKPRWS